jgi:hypothetical protein
MRSIEWWLVSALIAVLVLAEATFAQPPDPKEGPPRGVGPSARISVDDIVERIMAFDKNKDGKITKDELPERMHHLIEMGDTNKDGALDKDEIRALAAKLEKEGFGGRDALFGTIIDRDAIGPGPGPGGLRIGGPGPGASVVEGVVDDLKLSAKKKDQAVAAVKAHQENVRKLMDQARAELLEKMKEILSEEELKDFNAALDRPRGVTTINVGPGRR